ncbi:hypothetical protein Tco_0129540 [Tanacetum coccineum]
MYLSLSTHNTWYHLTLRYLQPYHRAMLLLGLKDFMMILKLLLLSTNGTVNTAHDATTASTQATAINSTTIDNLSDVVICAFFASQPNSPQLDNEDLQQIHPDDLEEMI